MLLVELSYCLSIKIEKKIDSKLSLLEDILPFPDFGMDFGIKSYRCFHYCNMYINVYMLAF